TGSILSDLATSLVTAPTKRRSATWAPRGSSSVDGYRSAAGRGAGHPQRFRFLVGQGAVRATGRQGLGIDPCPGPSVKAADDEAIFLGIQQGESKALVAARVLERVVAHEADALERSAAVGLERGRPPRQFVQMRGHLIDLVEVGLQNTFQRRRIRSPRQLAKALVEPPCPTGGEEKRDHRQKQRGDK